MSVLSASSQKQLEDLLVKNKIISEAQLTAEKTKADKEHEPFISLLVKDHLVSNEDLTKYSAKVNKVPYVNLSESIIDQKILDLIPKDIAEHYMAVPLGEIQHRVVVAMLDADNVQAIDFLSNKIGRPIKVYAASEEGIRNILQQYKVNIGEDVVGDISGAVSQSVAELAKDEPKAPVQSKKETNVATFVQDSPVSKILSTILEYAGNNRASDVHMEPTEDSFKIRCRIDGVLREIMKLPKGLEPALVSRVKILSNLKIDEHRVPQDGEFSIVVGNKKIDLRIAISPVVWGEQVVIRLLDKSSTSLKLEDMGYKGRALRAVRNGIAATSGMVLTSGPTGSGKSTSLYALLQEVKNDTVNIVTMEDPVEYKMEGINQIQVNPDVGLTFAAGLRSILRQDPDVIMVGEIRDHETAELAVQAALTGHLVFSTLHTNSAAGILPRLLDMGIEPFLIASTIRTVIGQRLVRRVAKDIETYKASSVEDAAIHDCIGMILPKTEDDVKKVSEDLGYQNLPLAGQNAYTLTRGIDSPQAPKGFKGRVGIYEAFEVTSSIQDLILKRATTAEIQDAARSEGMITMRQDGYLKALDGLTTIQEVDRVASADAS